MCQGTPAKDSRLNPTAYGAMTGTSGMDDRRRRMHCHPTLCPVSLRRPFILPQIIGSSGYQSSRGRSGAHGPCNAVLAAPDPRTGRPPETPPQATIVWCLSKMSLLPCPGCGGGRIASLSNPGLCPRSACEGPHADPHHRPGHGFHHIRRGVRLWGTGRGRR